MPLFLDLFAGGGGLSEGFINAGYIPVAHVEKDTAACYTLKTRMAYHWLAQHNGLEQYIKYLSGTYAREELYSIIPDSVINSVLNDEISDPTIGYIFSCVDELLAGKKLDLIVGGPPCQAYSVVGRSRDKNRMIGDPRNYLYRYYAAFLDRYKPEYFVFENVTGLLSARDYSGKRYFDSMMELFMKSGYFTEYKVINADEFGIPQKRKRIILVGSKRHSEDFFPFPKKEYNDVSIRELLADLPALRSGETCRPETHVTGAGFPVTLHTARPNTERDLEIYRIAVRKWNSDHSRLNYDDLPEYLKTHRNRDIFTDRFKVVAGDLSYSQTVLAHMSKDGHYYIHYDEKQNRSLTPREAARLQTFPDDYYFENTTGVPGRTAAFHQIGNAVPVKLAEKIAGRLLEVW